MAALVAASAGPADARPKAPTAPPLDLPVAAGARFRQPEVATGLADLRSGEPARAAAAFSQALQSDPRNAYLHFLNGATYHLIARQGDGSRQELAEVGYLQALKFDPNAWWAAYGLGLLKMDGADYAAAQDAFARALLIKPDHVAALKGLAASSYYLGDLGLAGAAIGRALAQAPDDRTTLRAAALISAAQGDSGRAEGYAQRYAALETAGFRRDFVRTRLAEWAGYFKVADDQASWNSAPATSPFPSFGTVQSWPPAAPPAAAPNAPIRGGQVVVDVVYVRSENIRNTGQGVNLLRGLQLQYAYSAVRTRSSLDGIADYLSATQGVGSAPPFPFANSITQSLTVPAITYSMNIFNTQEARNEIVARPTLIAQQGRPSTFFSGSELNIAQTGQYGGDISKVEVGISLEVTPLDVTDKDVVLQVAVRRTAFDDNIAGTFKEALQTSNNRVSATVTLGYDQTLILTGLTDRQKNRYSDHTPILGQIPGVQLLFKQRDTTEYDRTLLIMLTPHRPTAASPEATADAGQTTSPYVAELKKSWDQVSAAGGQMTPNLRSAFSHLRSNSLYRQLRAGDLAVDDDEPDGLAEAIRQDLQFLYF